MHAIIYIKSQGSHDLKVIDYIQYEGEKRIYLPIQLPIQEHLASEYFFFTSFKGECRPSLEVVARSKGYNTYESLALLTF